MKSLIRTKMFVAIAVAVLSASGATAANKSSDIVVILAGTGTAYDGNAQFEQFGLEPLDATCFGMDLLDAKTGHVIGQGSDCLSEIAPSGDGGGLMLTATTFFYFPGGTLVSRGRVTVQPVLTGSTQFTHITGAMPSTSDNSVIYGDGRFKHAYGPVRLSGAVNMSALNTDGIIVFDCVFILDI